MIKKEDKKFNCCESTLLRINDKYKLLKLGSSIMRVASNFGGGVAGWGSACGAITGSTMALGLIMGTDGTEPPEEFEKKRKIMRELTQSFQRSFEEKWGATNCNDLLGLDRRTPEGKKKHEEMKARNLTNCDEYVKWAAENIIKLLDYHV
jgi:C_GCAxxG_C_C family probable redox protein